MDDIIELDFKTRICIGPWSMRCGSGSPKRILMALLRSCFLGGTGFLAGSKSGTGKNKTLSGWQKAIPLSILQIITKPLMHAIPDVDVIKQKTLQKASPAQHTRLVLKQYDSVCSGNDIALWFTTNRDENSWMDPNMKIRDAAKHWLFSALPGNGMPLIYSGQELPNEKTEIFDKYHWMERAYAPAGFYKTLLFFKSAPTRPSCQRRYSCGNTFTDNDAR